LTRYLAPRPVYIKEITGKSDLKKSARLIRKSFQTVRRQFNLNRKNCPGFNSFIGWPRLYELKENGARFFSIFWGRKMAGFITVEKAGDGQYYLEKLAVLPAYRHNGLGKALVEHALAYCTAEGGKRVSIGLINENTVLKKWYKQFGFMEKEVKAYDHLPFTVCYMEMVLHKER